jgi:hypothetical protein
MQQRLLASFARRLRGASLAWIVRGTLVVLIALAGLSGCLDAVVAGFQALSSTHGYPNTRARHMIWPLGGTHRVTCNLPRC